MNNALPRALLLLCAVDAAAALGTAQSAPPPQQLLAFPYDSGWVSNPGASEAVLSSHSVRVGSAAWLRLRFQVVSLWNSGDESTGAFLRITSHHDGAVQELHAAQAREWKLTSAYFNGDTVQLEVVAPPFAGPSRVVLRSVWIGPLVPVLYSQCGPTDDRVPSGDPRCARVLPIGCSSWIFDDCNHGLTTAGHCAQQGSWVDVAQFNVPLSTPGGVLQHPGPEHQYAIDDTSIQFQNGGVGNDWAYFGCFPNSTTTLTPFQAQGACFRLVAPPPFSSAEVIRVTGYGTDANDPSYTQAQQTHADAYASYVGTTVRYLADTFGGNSGSPLHWESGGSDLAIGVHTHGGCSTSPPIGSNAGTASTQANWTNARANPLGVCAPVSSASVYCTPKVNSLGCTPSIAALGAASASGGAGSFVIRGSNLLNQKSGLLFYGYLPAAAPFQGGTRCVATPLRRTPLQSTGGAASGSSCTGVLDHDMGARIASGVDAGLDCGAIVYAQIWSRDPLDAFGTNLTAGLRFTIGP